ncbi:MAG: ABC transporter permease, partial [Chloroflexota bacterium]|nr:ABC transporter permease [Chloroflexota bacterium]
RNIPRRKAQTTLIVIGLMLSTLIITASLGVGDALYHSFTSDVYETLGPVDELVVRSGGDEPRADAATTQRIPQSSLQFVRDAARGNPDIDGVGGILFVDVPALNLGPEDPRQIQSFDDAIARARQSEPSVTLAGIDEESMTALGGLETTDGETIQLGQLGNADVVLSETAAEDLAASVGDYIGATANNQPFFLHVVAVAPDSALSGSLNPNSAGLVMRLDRLQQLVGAPDQLSAIGVSNTGGVRDGVERTDAVVAALEPVLAGQGLGVVPIKQSFVEQSEQFASVFVGFFLIFGLFSIAVGILLIVLIFMMLAAERRSEMGMARAIGARRIQLIQQFIAEGAGYSLMAGLVGVALGALAALGIAFGMGLIFGDFISVDPYIHPRSMVVAYCLGTVITFLTVTVSSWWVSRLNIVAAVRDIPEVSNPRRNWRQLMWGGLELVIGGLLTWLGMETDQAWSFLSGMSFIPIGIATIITYFGVKPRVVYTIAGLYLLVFWLLPEDAFEAIFGTYSGDIELFFLSGLFLVAASTLVIVQNLDALLRLTQLLGGAARGSLAAVRVAVAYPGANRGRTGMTIAMFALIVFSLVMVATLTENFSRIFLGDEANAGWDIRADIPTANPLDDIRGTLASRGVDLANVEAIGQTTQPNQFAMQLRNPNDEWKVSPINVMSDEFVDESALAFQSRAEGFESDQAILDALKTDPQVAIVDASAVPQQGGFGGDPNLFTVEGLEPNQETFAPITVEIIGPTDQRPQQITIIGVLDQELTTLWGMYLGQPAAQRIFPSPPPAFTQYYFRVTDATDSRDLAQRVEQALLPYGGQAVSIEEELAEFQQQQSSFLYILEGFMGLGLVVGIAAVGVIAFRSVVERRQAIGMLRALGFQRGIVALSFLIESAVIVLLGVLSGAVLGLSLAYLLLNSESFTQGAEVNVVFPWLTIAVMILIAVVAALLMSWLPARQASHVLPAEALRYE